MKFRPTPLAGLTIIEPDIFEDERGYFFESFRATFFKEAGIDDVVTQVSNSFSKRGVLRGLHFQVPPHAQSKLVRCVSGQLFDAAVDIRRNSATYGKWYGLPLTAENRLALYIPVGFAHGIYALTDCELNYICGGSEYVHEAEGGLRFNDEDIKIHWPLVGPAIVNERDSSSLKFKDFESPFLM